MTTYCNNRARGGKLRAGAEHTFDHADSRPDSAALSRPNSVKVSGWQGRATVRRAAWRDPCVQPLPAHPLPLNTSAGGLPKLITEPETMTTSKAGSIGAHARAYIPRHYLRRLAHQLASKAARRAGLIADRIGGAT